MFAQYGMSRDVCCVKVRETPCKMRNVKLSFV